jgi:beta-glucanase (GH16 family)
MLPLDYSNLHPSFDDEFNSLSLHNSNGGTWDTSFPWAGPTGASLGSNGELEWYINDSYAATSSVKPWSVSNGVLDLTAAPTDPSIQQYIGNYQYTSGMLTTHNSFAQTYGYFEMRAELPAGNGLAPAFWLLPEDGSWPPELDVMEMLGNAPTSLVTTVHSDSTGQHTFVSNSATVADMTDGFHTYGVDWEPNTITWYFDGNEIFQTATPADMHKPMYMVANLAVGGNWPGSPDGSTTFPASMQIDYIRAYATAAAPPVILTFSPDSNIVGDGITSASQITLNGTAEANAGVSIFDGATPIGTTTANSIGAWSFITGLLADGVHNFSATDINAAGNVSAASSALAITIDTTAPTVTQVASSPANGLEFPGNTIVLTLSFSEEVNVTGTPMLTLNDGGAATYTGGTGSNTLTFSYTVGTSDSMVSALAITQVNLVSGAAITDAAGNTADLSGALITFPGPGIDPPVTSMTATNADITGGVTAPMCYSGTQTARIALVGNYPLANFTASSDGHGGTSVIDPLWLAASASGLLAEPGRSGLPDNSSKDAADSQGALNQMMTLFNQHMASALTPSAFSNGSVLSVNPPECGGERMPNLIQPAASQQHM